jgi:hypothetical protein
VLNRGIVEFGEPGDSFFGTVEKLRLCRWRIRKFNLFLHGGLMHMSRMPDKRVTSGLHGAELIVRLEQF